MTSLKSRIYPRTLGDSYVAVPEDDLPLITYDGSASKSAQELLYEVNKK
jgi:hypothetical protein